MPIARPPEKTTKPYDGLSSDRMWSFETGDLDVLRRHIPEAAVVTPVISTGLTSNTATAKHKAPPKE